MNKPLRFALNRMVAPRLSLPEFIDLALALKTDAIEIRNDLQGVEIENGMAPASVRQLCEARGIKVLSINALYPFDVWNEERRVQAVRLADYARECGAQGLVMCPLNDRADPRSEAERSAGLRTALGELAPILRAFGVYGYIEPLGFEECSLRLKRTAVEAIADTDTQDVFRLVHDTLHHHLAGERECFAELTGLVHISGVEDALAPLATIRDGHRVLVGEGDILGNAAQIEALRAGGYDGYLSFEPFAESVHQLADLRQALGASMNHLQNSQA
ncbi:MULTISPECIES: TIM barrel protein [unclassified Pseudomonas]|uniref:TIM barrel protein n=1 Tax=unclassified Pseudomonas TaxID=196821 RepID=UPI0009243014|nr:MULTISPECIES: TIM barrel protein [unclassified Pseudomonas]SFX79711.1 2-keto-myo-inositol isomerase [Pseudomonas sp. NFACC47-1]SFY31526.1 2-keto-myo-inositol isomerase [Pseudomonas sp. NFACC43]